MATPLIRSLKSAISRIALVLAGVLALAMALLWIFQEQFVFLPPAVPGVQGRGSTRIDYAASDGQPLFGFLVAARDSMVGAIIVFHGNGDLADSWIDWAHSAASRTRLPIFLGEYRGYGGLAGRPTYVTLMRDTHAALDVIMKRYALRPEQIVLFGHSLGSGVATSLAVERSPRALVLEAPVTSLLDMGRRSFGPPISWLLPLISRSPFAPVDQIRGVAAPVWVAVGGRDDVVPAEMGRAVFAAAPQKGELLEITSANHGDISDRGGEGYWQWLTRAVRGAPTVNP